MNSRPGMFRSWQESVFTLLLWALAGGTIAVFVWGVLHLMFSHPGTFIRGYLCLGMLGAGVMFYRMAIRTEWGVERCIWIFAGACSVLCAVFSVGVLP